MLQINFFQLAGNSKVKFKASESCIRHTKNELRGPGVFLKTKKKQRKEITFTYCDHSINFFKKSRLLILRDEGSIN